MSALSTVAGTADKNSAERKQGALGVALVLTAPLQSVCASGNIPFAFRTNQGGVGSWKVGSRNRCAQFSF